MALLPLLNGKLLNIQPLLLMRMHRLASKQFLDFKIASLDLLNASDTFPIADKQSLDSNFLLNQSISILFSVIIQKKII